MMTFTQAAFYGMGLVLLFGVASLVIAYLSKTGKSDEDRHLTHAK